MLLRRYSYRPLMVPALVLASFMLIAAQAGDFSTLEELFIWIFAGGGSMILAGKVIALFLENLTWWHGLPRTVKLLFPIVLAGVFGVLAQSIVVADLLMFIPAQAQAVILLLINWLFSQLQYKAIKAGTYAESAHK